MSRLTVGTLFTQKETRPYTENGQRGTHSVTLLAAVTSTDGVGFEYAVLRVLEETGRPSFAGTPRTGSYAWFGWDAARARGDVKAV